MPEPYTLIGPVLEKKNLRAPILNVLIPDGEVYSTLLFQHKGDVAASNTGFDRYVRNQNKSLAVEKFNAFFEIANQEEIDLVLTPEYSCPWDVIDNLITSNLLPKTGKIWIVGCESIRPAELREFRDKHALSVLVIADEGIDSTVANKFLDPVCILFRTKEIGSEAEKMALVIQFKVTSMGGDFEKNSLIAGKQRYVLHNEGDDGIRFAVIICSDSSGLALDASTFPNFNTYPYLIVHLQLNPKSKHTEFKSYRTSYFGRGKDDECHKELICINWADGTQLPIGNGPISLESGGTAIYFKWHRLDATDNRVVPNDSKGLFYNNWSEGRTSVYNVVPVQGLFLFTSAKCSQTRAIGADSPRTGPKMTGYWKWQDGQWVNKGDLEVELRPRIENVLGNDFDEIIFGQVLDGTLSFLDIERFLLLTNGQIMPENKKAGPWTFAPNLRSLQMKSDEYSRRFTYIHDSDADSDNWRRTNFFKFVKIGRILQDQSAIVFTDGRYSDFAESCSLEYSAPNLNIVSSKGRKAALAFFEHLNKPAAERNHETITTAMRENTNDEVNLVVVYNTVDNTLHSEFPKDAKLDENLRKGHASILGRGGE